MRNAITNKNNLSGQTSLGFKIILTVSNKLYTILTKRNYILDTKNYHITAEGSRTEIIVSVDQLKNIEIVGSYNGYRHEYSHNYLNIKNEMYEKNLLKHYNLSISEVLFPDLVRFGKKIEMLEPHNLFYVMERLKKNKKLGEPTNKMLLTENQSFHIKDKKNCLHPSYPAVFKYKDKTFISINQFMAYSKAIIANDNVSAFNILDFNNCTSLIKSFIDNEINDFDIVKNKNNFQMWNLIDYKINEISSQIEVKDEWNDKKVNILKFSVREKINQNDHISKYLTELPHNNFLFISESKKLGIGTKIEKHIKDNTWTGDNLFGQIIMDNKKALTC